MRSLVAIGLTLLSGSAFAELPADRALTLKAAGEGKWSVWCDFVPLSGDSVIEELTPGKRDTYSSSALRRADCHYKNAPRAPLLISIEGAAWVCPFKDMTAGKCETTIPKGGFGEFSLRLARR